MARSTVVGNEALGGTGGHGGLGGPGPYGGQDGGDSGNGDGVYAVSLLGPIGDGGFGSLGGQITDEDGNPVENLPFRYEAEMAEGVASGATHVLLVNADRKVQRSGSG